LNGSENPALIFPDPFLIRLKSAVMFLRGYPQNCLRQPRLLSPHLNLQLFPGFGEVESTMLWLIFLILLIAWILGVAGTYQIGAFVWLLLVAAVVVLVIQLVTGRRPVA
jgi:hypothetical protein